MLGRLSGRPDFEQLVEQASEALAAAVGREDGAASVDGLVPGRIAPSNGRFLLTGAKLTVGGHVDSYYEYLLKRCVCLSILAIACTDVTFIL